MTEKNVQKLPPEDWVETKLGEIVEIQPGFAFKSKDFVLQPWFPVLKIKNINPPFVNLYENEFVNISNYSSEKLEKFEVRKWDFIIAMTWETIWKIWKYLHSNFAYLNQRVCKVVRNNTTDYDFIYYSLIREKFQKYINIHSFWAAQANISTTEIWKFKILLPPLPEQHAIADMLSSFDDKIELLREQNKTLEELGQTIFREWFGKYSVHDELPEGWRVGRLGEVVDHVKNNIIPSKAPNRLFAHYSIPSFDDGKKASLELGEIILSNKYEVIANSFLVSKLNPSTPRIWTIFHPEENAVCSTEFQVLKPRDEKYFTICHYFLNSQIFTDELSQRAHGTSSSHQRVKPQDILNLDFLIPTEKEIVLFQEKVLPFLEKIRDNSEQIQSLTRSRDELLPKLMSGEVRVGV